MKPLLFCLALILAAGIGLAWAQPYDAAPATYGEYHHASTAGEGALRGMASVARSAGSYNLQTSQAAINMTEAQSNYIKNRDEATNTYFQMREANKEYRARARAPRPTMEALVRYAQAGKPKRMSASELDSVAGSVAWPTLLQVDRYADSRAKLEKLFAKRAEQGVISYEDQAQIAATTKAMLAELKGQVRDVPQMDYIAAKRFIESIAYEAKIPAS
jgi:hypothetical protein